MKLWTTTSFKGHYPVGAAAVVVAHDAEEAVCLLNEALKAHGLNPTITEQNLCRVSMGSARAIVLCDGDY